MKINKIFKMDSVFLFLFLILYPFGQIIRIGIVQPIDVVVGLAATYTIFARLKKPDIFKYFNIFLTIVCFSWLFSMFLFHQISVLYGLLYLFRLFAYLCFYIYVWNFAKEKSNRKLILSSLLSVSIISAVFGWVQLAIFPDIKPLFVLGWDMHLYRLVGTFFDPTYLGLIIVFGLIISISRLINEKDKRYLIVILFLTLSLAFTYSRASFIAFFVSLLVIAINKRIFKPLLVLALGLSILVFVLPTTKNHSIELFRSFSAVARIENYASTLKIFSKSPVFGIGYDNMCIAYQKYIGYQEFSSHACSGSDSSLLFILSTSGVLGLIAFLYGIKRIAYGLPQNNIYYLILSASFITLLIHSLFSNSMFYPWIMGWMVILLAEVYSN